LKGNKKKKKKQKNKKNVMKKTKKIKTRKIKKNTFQYQWKEKKKKLYEHVAELNHSLNLNAKLFLNKEMKIH
jgi:hypothetical protein